MCNDVGLLFVCGAMDSLFVAIMDTCCCKKIEERTYSDVHRELLPDASS
jgi:hypothetical protein